MNLNKIIIKNLEVFAYHGLYLEEMEGQFFNLSFVLKTNFEKAAESDFVDHTIDYDEFCWFAEQTFRNKRFNLMEAATLFLAEKLILKFKQLKEIKISVHKKNAKLKNKSKILCAKIEVKLKWRRAFLGLGSNLGNKLKNMETAIEKLKSTESIKLKKISKIEQTKAYGREMDDFLNCVVEIETFSTPKKLLQICNTIENELKRERKAKWSPRTIDLDILFYENLILTTNELTIPHYDIKNRSFVLKPMVELCPNFIHPVFFKTVTELEKELNLKTKNTNL